MTIIYMWKCNINFIINNNILKKAKGASSESAPLRFFNNLIFNNLIRIKTCCNIHIDDYSAY